MTQNEHSHSMKGRNGGIEKKNQAKLKGNPVGKTPGSSTLCPKCGVLDDVIWAPTAPFAAPSHCKPG